MNIDYELVNALQETIFESYKSALKLDKNIRDKVLNDIVT